jgi:hypothetical protein
LALRDGSRATIRRSHNLLATWKDSRWIFIDKRSDLLAWRARVDFDEWAANGNSGWSYDEVLAYFNVADGEWRDNLDRVVAPPEVNFAGRYFIAVHSCGTGCRYYTLTDLSSGLGLDFLRVFDAGQRAPKTRDGYPYVTDLITRANSKLLVAQYHVDLHGREECRERTFVFVGGKITAISKTRRACTRY